MNKSTDEFDSSDIQTDGRSDNDLPGQSDSDSLPHINQFFANLNGKEDVPTAYDPIRPLDPTQMEPIGKDQEQSETQGDQEDLSGQDNSKADGSVEDHSTSTTSADNSTDGGGTKRSKRRIVAVVSVFVALAIAIGAALYFGLPKLIDSISSKEPKPTVPVITEPVCDTYPAVTTTEKPTEPTTAEPTTEEPTTDPDLKYAPGTYYVNVTGGTPLYLETSTFSVVQWLVPEGTKVEVTEVQVGSSFDGAKLNFGKINYRSQTGWIKMDSTAEKQSDTTSGIDYDAVLRCNAEYWKDYDDADVLAAYAGEVKRLTDEYGAGRIGTTKVMSEDLCGLNIVRLIDLDQDGQPELYCAYCREGESAYEKKQAVYQYAGNGKTERLYEGDYTYKSSDYSPYVVFRENNGILYFAAGSGQDRYYFVLSEGEFDGTEILESYADGVAIRIDGIKVTAEEYKRAIDKYEGGKCYTISLYGYSNFKNENQYVDDILSETTAVVNMLAQYESVVAEKTSRSIDEPPERDAAPHDRPWEDDPYQWDYDTDDYDWE